MSRIVDLIVAQPWAMTEIYLRAMLELAERQAATPNLDELRARYEALNAKPGRVLPGTAGVTRRGDTALVPVSGPIFRYANVFTELSGATSLEKLAADFQAQVDDAKVKRILLVIDSPGGQVNGIAEFASLVRDAQARKPVAAFVGGAACSAAYWIASAAGRIFIASTAELGSIGVVQVARGKDPNAIEIVSSRAPYKRVDPATDDGRARLQAQVDRVEQEFVSDIAANRGVDAETVLEKFGQGDVLFGSDAVDAGMADEVTTLERLLSRLTAESQDGNDLFAAAAARQEKSEMTTSATALPAGGAPAAATTTPPAPAPAAAPAPAPAPAPAAPDLGAVRAEAANAERQRVLAIQGHARMVPGHDALVASMIADPTVTAEAAASRLLEAQAEKAPGQTVLAAIAADGAATGKPAPAPSALATDQPQGAFDQTPDGWRKEWSAKKELQAEFVTADDYVAIRGAETRGAVKVLSGKAAK